MTTNPRLSSDRAVTASATVQIWEEDGAWQVYAMRPVWMGSAATLPLANALAAYVRAQEADGEPGGVEEPAPAPEPSPLAVMPRTLAAMTDADREALRAQGILPRPAVAAATVEAAFPTPAPAPSPVPVPPAPEPEPEPEPEPAPPARRATIWRDGFIPHPDDLEPPFPGMAELGAEWSEAEDDWLTWALRNDRPRAEISALTGRSLGSIAGRKHALDKRDAQSLVGRKRA